MPSALTSKKSQVAAEPGADKDKAKEARREQREAAKAQRKAEREAAKANKAKKSPFRAEGEPLIESLEGFSVPADKNPPKRADFKNEWDFFELKAREADARAKKLREMAEESKAGGSVADKAKAKKLKNLTSSLGDLQSELEAEGVDVSAFLKSLEEAKAKKRAAAAQG